jgi:hypothetical protein
MKYAIGDKVRIIDALYRHWIGEEGTITNYVILNGVPILYNLDIGGGNWSDRSLMKIN